MNVLTACGQSEEWRSVPGYEPYEVSTMGRVRRGDRVLAGCLDGDGYRRISTSVAGRRQMIPVHTMVLLAFIGPRPTSSHQGAHGPAGKTVNTPENLSWATPKDQYRDRVRDGTDNGGERSPRAKLTKAQAEEIRRIYVPRSPTTGCLALAARFNVTRGAIDGIVNKGGWR